jgi:hypothetical protein
VFRRPHLAWVLTGFVLAAGCGTTVPLADQQLGSGPAGFSVPTTAPTSGTGGGTTGGATGITGGGTTGTTGGTTGIAGGSATGTPGGSTTTGGAPSAPGSAVAIPASGRGWDAKNVYIGIPTAEDFDRTVRAAGASGSNGNVRGDVDAIVASINKEGGLFGRRVVAAYHDAATADYAYNPTQTAQEMCTYFTQDRPVIAIINGAPQLDGAANFHTCLQKAGVSLLSLSNTDYNDADYRRLGPHLWSTGSLSTDVLVPSLVASLSRQRFFTGWDVLNGSAGSAPVKVGALLPDTAQGRRVGSLLTAALKRQRLKLDSVFHYNPAGLGTDSQAEVLQMKSAGVTHILTMPPIAAEIWFFQGASEQQRYRPRYGFTSFNLPLSVEENASLAPARQQIGSMGIGWQPYNDTNATHDPGPTPGSKKCLAALAAGNQRFTSSQRRGALIAHQLCDALYLLRDAVREGKGFSGPALINGMPPAGTKLRTAGTFAGGLTPNDRGLPGAYRDQQYQAACSCFVYTGPVQRFSR